MAAMLLPALLAVTGLVLDGGMVYQVKRRMQTAADAAALGGAHELWRQNSGLVVSAARNDAGLNGFEHNVNATVTVNNPPAGGPRAGDANFVEVIVSQEVKTTFLRIVNRNSSTVRSRAVAGLVKYADGCVMALNPTARGALTVQGASTLTSGCGVMVNSNDNRAIEANGGGCIYADEVAVTGGWMANGSANCINPPPDTEQPRALDPMAYLAAPILPSTNTAVNFRMSTGTATLNPGRYRGGIDISGGTVTFNPGVYILDGGGLQVTGNAVISGNGVTFYNTNTGAPGQWGDFSIAGSVRATLSAPDSGPYEGILFWNDPSAPERPPGSIIAGTSDSKFEGAMYFPSTHVTWAGTSTAAAWNMIIADTITVTGNAKVESDFSSSTIEPPTRKATLLE